MEERKGDDHMINKSAAHGCSCAWNSHRVKCLNIKHRAYNIESSWIDRVMQCMQKITLIQLITIPNTYEAPISN